jgi:hypothetical protein
MKKISPKIFLASAFALILCFSLSSCQKDTDGSPETSAGTPTFGAITPTEGAGGTVVTITGSGLGRLNKIAFEKDNVPVSFSPNLNTETAIIFRVPDTAIGGVQNIVLTNIDGKSVSVPFKVIALPIISSIYPTDFQQGTTVTIMGNNFEETSKVVIDGTTDEATIVSKEKKKLVVQMPASAVNRGKLTITNVSGSNTSTIEMVNVDKAVQVFTDALVNGFESWSWGGTFTPSTDFALTGTSSMQAAYDPAGSWGGMQLGNGGSIDITGCKYFAFWAKADEDVKIQVNLNWVGWTEFTVPAGGAWTYFRYDLATIPAYAAITSVNNVTYQIMGDGKTVYFDNIVFVK